MAWGKQRMAATGRAGDGISAWVRNFQDDSTMLTTGMELGAVAAGAMVV